MIHKITTKLHSVGFSAGQKVSERDALTEEKLDDIGT
jgi:hypothetical protein